MNQLIAFLRDHLILDFQGDLTLEQIREFLKNDDSRGAKTLMAKVVADKGVDDMLIVLSDCLLAAAQKAMTDDLVREELRNYSES
jgi:hypothetical protein